jgi:polar amino acid transport system substrate-binding protein
LANCSPQNESWRRIEQAGVIRVGIDPTYPPFEAADAQTEYGLDVDLAAAIAEDLGLQAEFVHFGYDGLYDALLTHQVDVLISALTVSQDKTRDFAFSDSYYDAGQMLVSRLSSPYNDYSELSNKALAVELGSEGHVIATTWQRQVPELSVIPYVDPNEVLAAVSEGHADAAIIDNTTGRLFLAHEDDLVFSETPITHEPYVFVVRIADELLLSNLNASLARLRDSQKLDQIVERWLNPSS